MSFAIRSVWYGAPGSPYARMARVLECTARRYHSDVRVECLAPAFDGDRSEAFRRKAVDWATRIRAGGVGLLCLLDADIFLQHSLLPVTQYAFDIAITEYRGRLNSGVLFVRPSTRVSAFFEQWAARTSQWCDRNAPGAIRYGDQDALAEMLKEPHGLQVRSLPMKRWNSTQRTWHIELDAARVVHFKSKARKHVFEGVDCNPISRAVADRWRAWEREAINAGP